MRIKLVSLSSSPVKTAECNSTFQLFDSKTITTEIAFSKANTARS